MSNTVTESSTFSASVTVPAAGEDVTAASILTVAQPLANRTKYLRARAALDTTGANDAGYANDSNAANFNFSGTTAFLSGSQLTMASGSTLLLASGSTTIVGARTRMRAPAYLSSAAHTLDKNNNANVIVIDMTGASASYTLTLRQSTSPVPDDGDWFEVTVLLGTNSHTIALQREGSMDYVAVIGDGVGTSPYGSSNLAGTARVQLVSGVWRLVSIGGVAFYGSDA